jgi:hypothetical protein
LSKLRKTSQYRGVSWNVANSYWISQITSDYKKYHLGNFASEEDAGRAYDRAAKRLFGTKALLNFPAARESYVAGRVTAPAGAGPRSRQRSKDA